MVAKAQEIPATFTAETGWPRFDDCALVTSMNFTKEWPLHFRRYASWNKGVSAVSVGGGWAKFCEDHSLGEGAFLTFEVVDARSLVVALHARGALGSHQRSQEEWIVEAGSQRPWSEHVPPPEDNRSTRQWGRGVQSDLPSDQRPQFQKTLRKTHMTKNDCGRLVSTDPKSNNCRHPLCQYRVIVRCSPHAGSFGSSHAPEMMVLCNWLFVHVGCADYILAHSWSGGVRWTVLHPQRPAVDVLGEDSHAYEQGPALLFIHKGICGLLCRQRTQARRHPAVHEGWLTGIRGPKGVTAGIARGCRHASAVKNDIECASLRVQPSWFTCAPEGGDVLTCANLHSSSLLCI